MARSGSASMVTRDRRSGDRQTDTIALDRAIRREERARHRDGSPESIGLGREDAAMRPYGGAGGGTAGSAPYGEFVFAAAELAHLDEAAAVVVAEVRHLEGAVAVEVQD